MFPSIPRYINNFGYSIADNGTEFATRNIERVKGKAIHVTDRGAP
jgi:hypothetical protein